MVHDEQVRVIVHDSGGMERFATIPRNYYSNVHGAIVVYDVESQETFDNTKWWIKEAMRNGTENAVFLLMGNKCDSSNRVVDKEEAMALAKEHGALFAEVSSRTGTNLEQAFQKLTTRMIHQFGDRDDMSRTEKEKDDDDTKRPAKETTSSTRGGGTKKFCSIL